ncbi:MAG TPA: hypothetical protein VMF14_05780, partial [Solirubrobacteraceae bacterium]|nr:hypothetical protein [Solirubrobacteraceae bacterium]
YFAPGLFLIGAGVGVMLTPSVNVVQSAFPENLQGEISGLSRSVSNLGAHRPQTVLRRRHDRPGRHRPDRPRRSHPAAGRRARGWSQHVGAG